MEITPELVRKLGRLSRLALTPEEEARLEGELRAIVGFFEKLSELDTDGLPAMARPVEITNRLRLIRLLHRSHSRKPSRWP